MEEQLSPRERRALRTREAILEAARHIINKEGVNALSIRAIADAIDYSPAGLYEYFGSKEEIIMAVVAQGFERFTRALESADTTLPAVEYIKAVGLAYIDFAVRYPDFFLLMFTTAPLSDLYAAEWRANFTTEDLRATLDQEPSFAVLYRAVERCVAEGIFQTRPGYDIFEMALTTWGHVHGLAMLRVTYFRDSPIDFTAIDLAGMGVLQRGFSSQSQ
jgi:AcrR family transcriptional regulator